jgi:hypothetical protein
MVAICGIGLYLKLNIQTDPIEENFRVENVELSTNYQKNSGKISFDSETEMDQPPVFELIFFLFMLVFTVFLTILHFYDRTEKARKYQKFERSIEKQRQITYCVLLTQACDQQEV